MLFARNDRGERPIRLHKHLLLAGTALAALPLGLIICSGEVQAQDATWLATPISNDWRLGANWSSGIAPLGTAIFGESDVTSLNVTDVNIGTLRFDAAAPAYTLTNGPGGYFEITGAGIVNHSANRLMIANSGQMFFYNASMADSAIIANSGHIRFRNTSTAAAATITTTDNGSIFFGEEASGGQARLITQSGLVDISWLTSSGMSVGSIEGSGTYYISSKALTVGGNGLSTTVSGTIQDGGNRGGTGGSLIKVGAGTLTLSGANTYTGGTSIEAGTLEIQNPSALGSGNVTLKGGHLRSDIAGTATLANPIVVRAGDPVRTISAAAGQTLNINFNFVGNGAVLQFGTASDTGTVSIGGTVSGGYGIYWIDVAGGTLKAGSRALSTLLSGGAQALTIRENATVDLASYDSTFFDLRGRGTLTGNGATFSISEGAFDGNISGNTTLKKITPVTLTLNGRNTLTGPTQVLNGLLVVNGSLASSPVSVSHDTHGSGTLGGTGTVGSLSVLSRGTVAPGNSIGTLTVNGNVSFAPGSTYALEIDKAGRADRIAASGAATLSGGTVRILPDQGTGYAENSPYLILTARNGVKGTFAGTSGGNFAFVTPTLAYDDDKVTLTLVRKMDPDEPDNPADPDEPRPIRFHSVAETVNQYRTADAVEALGSGNHLFQAVLGSSDGAARQAFDALSGEAHASAMSVAYEDSRLVREAILTRLREPMGAGLPSLAQGSYAAAYAADRPGAAPQDIAVPSMGLDPHRFALWGEGFGSWAKVASNGNAASLETSTGGFILGADGALDPVWRLGLAGGFTRTSFDINGRLSSGTNESVFGALYGSGSWGAFSLRLGAAYAWHDVDIRRRVLFPGFADATETSYDGWSAQGFAELGYRFDLAGVQFEPFIGGSILRLHTGAFQEEGGTAALTGFGQDQDLATTTLGLRAQARLSADVPLAIRGMLGWRHAFGDVEPEALLAFAGSAAGFAVSGVPVDRDALAIEAGLDWKASDSLSLGVAYAGQIGARAQDHSLKGNLVWRFATH
ncbi:outer membrane autotransporter protein [Microvirga lupini]|uniref:Outer membrane autotransporter protein n=1 Tax=Microvirga lupini TaxID=420324 RepID=A0A7W4VPP1_9HYPH|nr:autotransporter domain-containing protein [Microvirga lupini]MBB3021012.1 outer membrane autotransporter protein [Microvirga lupini]